NAVPLQLANVLADAPRIAAGEAGDHEPTHRDAQRAAIKLQAQIVHCGSRRRRSRSAGKRLRTSRTWPEFTRAKTTCSSSPPRATSSPQGPTTRLLPRKRQPRVSPAALQATTYERFSIARARFSTSQCSRRG